MTDEPRGCLYCNATKRTREHALATQLAELIPTPTSAIAERVTVDRDRADVSALWPVVSTDFVVVRDFCAGCNSGFMNDIDKAIKTGFADLVLGKPLTLDPDGIDLWARWITKVFLSYQTAYPDPLALPEHYRMFKADQRPLPGTQIYMAVGAGLSWPHLHARRPMTATDPFDGSDPRPAMQIWTAVYGLLIVQVIQDLGVFPVPGRPDNPTYARLWPDPPDSIDLGVLARLDEAGVAALTKFRPLFEPASE